MATDNFAPVVAALTVMQSSAQGPQKEGAHEFLNRFQKSKETWSTTHEILASSQASTEAKLFAATTLKGKITYDLDQLPPADLTSLRDSILSLLVTYSQGPRPIRTQLCVCLANLAIQMTQWKDVLQVVGSTLGPSAGDCVLEFLQVLPEEVIEGRKINLSEEDLNLRSKELLGDNTGQVLRLLVNYAASSEKAASNPHLLECITSWLREIPAEQIVKSPLLDTILSAISVESSFDSAVECLLALFRDTREVDESMELIQVLYPRVLALRPKIKEAAESDDAERLKGITRIFAEAGEAWVVLITRMPKEFRELVEAILECCARDREKEAVAVTFFFWFEFKQMVTMDRFAHTRQEYSNIFAKLVDIMIKHLEFPKSDGGDETDLFDGDRELEEKFREFRHQMGDVLKDCCEVISVRICLAKAFELIKNWVSTYASQATDAKVPHWQELEAPLFAMRAMGRMVSPEESVVLHQVIPLIVQIPNHEKLRFQAIMAIGRYTEWTSQHPAYLQPQLKFVLEGFQHPSTEVVRAAALAFRFFGTDCRSLLEGEVMQLHGFYDDVLDKLPSQSQEEVTEGAAGVVSAQKPEKIYAALKLYCDPIMERLKQRANEARGAADGKAEQILVADTISLLTIFINNVQPYYERDVPNQAVSYCQEILPVLSAVGDNFTTSNPILEALCRCWRAMVLTYRTAVLPLLPSLAQQLASGFEVTRQGCFLWATDAVLREFAAGADYVDPSTSQAIYNFFEQQAVAFLKIMNDLAPQDLPDVIEDFFRLLQDALIYYHSQLILANICAPILTAAISALALQQDAPILSTLHYLRDLLSYGTDRPNSSSLGPDPNRESPTGNGGKAEQLKAAVRSLVAAQGEALVQRVLTGMMFSFPSECLQDASGTILGLFELVPQETATWIKNTVDILPAGTVKAGEAGRLMASVGQNIQSGELRKIRMLLQDFTTSYRRRNVAPREGLGRLEATRFKFNT